jgi:hypothetical protein
MSDFLEQNVLSTCIRIRESSATLIIPVLNEVLGAAPPPPAPCMRGVGGGQRVSGQRPLTVRGTVRGKGGWYALYTTRAYDASLDLTFSGAGGGGEKKSTTIYILMLLFDIHSPSVPCPMICNSTCQMNIVNMITDMFRRIIP